MGADVNLFVCIETLHPSQQFSVMLGHLSVFLCWTSTQHRIKCLAQGHNTVIPVSLELMTLRPKSNTLLRSPQMTIVINDRKRVKKKNLTVIITFSFSLEFTVLIQQAYMRFWPQVCLRYLLLLCLWLCPTLLTWAIFIGVFIYQCCDTTKSFLDLMKLKIEQVKRL